MISIINIPSNTKKADRAEKHKKIKECWIHERGYIHVRIYNSGPILSKKFIIYTHILYYRCWIHERDWYCKNYSTRSRSIYLYIYVYIYCTNY